MSYLSLYRKYRPRLFSDFTGQAHIIRTLKNAISGEMISHAYLFAGPRGTGKTSAAKVLAKAVNCEAGFDPPEPCNQCPTCQRIEKGSFLEIIEIDAASNRGIDEIRQLKSNVRFYPTEGRYKVYIIDEVHMLTTEAFNALLKTLEEPPPYIIFILATTEPHRLLPTILSRCQRFDFKYLTTGEIQERLSFVAQKEDISLNKQALALIARSAEGGMRDALSLLDQILAYGMEEIDVEAVSTMLGIIRQDVFIALTEDMIQGHTGAGLTKINSLLDEGRDVEQIVKGLMYHFRNLLLLKECGPDHVVLDLPAEDLSRLEELSCRMDGDRLLRMVKILSQAQADLRWTHNPGFILEKTFIQLTKMKDNGDLAGRLLKLEKMIQEGIMVTGLQEEAAAVEEARKTRPLQKKDILKTKKEEKRDQPTRAKSKGADPADLGVNWEELMNHFHKRDKQIHACLLYCQPMEKEDHRLVLAFKNRIFLERMEKKRDIILRAVESICGCSDIEMVLEGSKEQKEERREKKSLPSPEEDPRVKKVLQVFQGKIIKIMEEQEGS